MYHAPFRLLTRHATRATEPPQPTRGAHRARAALAFAVALAVAANVVPVGRDGGFAVMAKGHAQSVTRTFSNGTSIIIPDSGTFGKSNPYPLPIRVSGLERGTIRDVNVTLRGFSHQHAEDVDMLLVAPDGKNAIFFSEVGGANTADNVTLTVDDEAAVQLSTAPLGNGRFRPANLDEHGTGDPFTDAPTPSGAVALSTFDGSTPNGRWLLYVFDNSEDDTGALFRGYQLTITARVKGKARGRHRSASPAQARAESHRRHPGRDHR